MSGDLVAASPPRDGSSFAPSPPELGPPAVVRPRGVRAPRQARGREAAGGCRARPGTGPHARWPSRVVIASAQPGPWTASPRPGGGGRPRVRRLVPTPDPVRRRRSPASASRRGRPDVVLAPPPPRRDDPRGPRGRPRPLAARGRVVRPRPRHADQVRPRDSPATSRSDPGARGKRTRYAPGRQFSPPKEGTTAAFPPAPVLLFHPSGRHISRLISPGTTTPTPSLRVTTWRLVSRLPPAARGAPGGGSRRPRRTRQDSHLGEHPRDRGHGPSPITPSPASGPASPRVHRP